MLTPNQKITEEHFRGTFKNPDDLPFLGDTCKTLFLCDVFNDMVSKRINSSQSTKTSPQVKKSGKFAKCEYDYHIEIYKKS